MKNRFAIAVRFLAISLVLYSPLVRADSAKARERWMAGYVKLEEGGKAEETGNLAGALDLYREALEIFREVQRDNPSWNPSLLTYRISYCEGRIGRLTGEVARQREDLTRGDLAKLTEEQAGKVRQLADENAELRGRLILAERALERARGEAARTVAATTDVQDVMIERNRLKDLIQIRDGELAKLKEEVAELRSKSGLEDVSRKLREELSLTQARQAELEKAYDIYRRAYENVKERLNRASAEYEASMQGASSARKERDEAVAKLEEALRGADALREAVVKAEGEKRAADEVAAAKSATADELRARLARADEEVAALREYRDRAVAAAEEGRALREQVGKLTEESEGLRRETQEAVALARTRAAERDALRRRLVAAGLADDTGGDGADPAVTGIDPARPAEENLKIAMLRVAELEKERDAGRTRIRQLEADIGDGEAVRKAVTEHKALLAAGEKRIEELSALAALLPVREKELAAGREQLDRLRADLEREQAAVRVAREEATAGSFEVARLTRRLETVETRNRELGDELAALRKQDRPEDGTTREDRLREAEGLVKTLEAERDRLSRLREENVALLRRQEETIGALEKERSRLQEEARSAKEAVGMVEDRAADAATKAEVFDGLAASLGDADRKMALLTRKLEQAETARTLAGEELRDLKDRLDAKDREIGRYMDMISGEGDDPAAASRRKLLEQIRELALRLEKETQRRRTLEAVLAKADTETEPALPEPAAPEVSEEGERLRREREQEMIVRGLMRQAVAAEKDGKIEAALHNYKRVLDRDPQNKVAAQRSGLILAETGNDEEAVRYLRRAFKLDPDDLDTLLPLGFALVRRSDPDLAISMLSRAAALDPDNPVVHRCLGIACSTLGWYDAAESQFRRTHALNSRDGENAFNMAILLATRTPPRLEEAREWYTRARELGTDADPGLDRLLGAGN